MKHKDCKCKPCTCGKEVICKCAERLKKLKEKLKQLIIPKQKKLNYGKIYIKIYKQNNSMA